MTYIWKGHCTFFTFERPYALHILPRLSLEFFGPELFCILLSFFFFNFAILIPFDGSRQVQEGGAQ